MEIYTLEFLIKKEIFSLTNLINEYKDVVNNKEIKMSRVILENNWNIGCIFHHYNNVDFTDKNIYESDIFKSDINFNKYYDELIHPYELVFIKEKHISNKKWINTYINKKLDKTDSDKKHDNILNFNNILFIILVIFGIIYYKSLV
jgi:hypothetical protein